MAIPIPLDNFLPGVQRFVAGCSSFTAREAIREKAIDFCKRTRLWTDTDTWQLSNATNTIDIDQPDNQTEILEIEAIRVMGWPVLPQTTEWMDHAHPRWRDELLTGTPKWFIQQSIDQITFVPSDNLSVDVNLIYMPAEGCTTLPDFLFRRYKNIICAGAIADLLVMPNQPWTETYRGYGLPAISMQKKDEYESGVAKAVRDKVRGVQRAHIRARGQYF
jgi:hypothetical protein